MAMSNKKLAKAQNKSRKTGNRHKWTGRNNGPARQRYWLSGRLEQNKVRSLMRHNGMTRQQATDYWRSVRMGRVKGTIAA